MADQVEKETFESEEKHSIEKISNESEEKEHKFKNATVKLKAEALRRFNLQEVEDQVLAIYFSKHVWKNIDLLTDHLITRAFHIIQYYSVVYIHIFVYFICLLYTSPSPRDS